MPSSPSSSSPSSLRRLLASPWLVWTLRILVGAVFVLSGFVKGVDPWGSVIKIGEYFTVWGIPVPGAVVTFCAFLLAGYEFVWGLLLMLGCYRRASVWLLTLQMAVMLPLTLYILIADPVEDCGCFGDFIILSNAATFSKNLLLTLALVYLIRFNTRVRGLYIDEVQWIVGGLVTFYILLVELYGYNIQPMLDFRRFAPGTMLVAEEEDKEATLEYTYERDGIRQTFTLDALPDSTWTFVDSRVVGGEVDDADGFTIIGDDGEDIAPELIDNGTEMFIVTIPDVDRVDLSATYLLNDLNEFIEERGGSMLALVGSDRDRIAGWEDVAMTTYPVERAEPRLLSELARGNAALVYLDHGRVVWKRMLTSLNGTMVSETPSAELIDALDPQTLHSLPTLTVIFAGTLTVIFILDRSGKLLHWHFTRRRMLRRPDTP
ncbi:MAG: DoxX family protein, partial [Duncaniella sp.]|nr:DoxX family protein [Duncaniella sp.]